MSTATAGFEPATSLDWPVVTAGSSTIELTRLYILDLSRRPQHSGCLLSQTTYTYLNLEV